MSSIRRTPLVALLGAALGGALGAACGGGHAAHTALVAPVRDSTTPSPGVDSLAALAARQARDSAADQSVLDSLHGPRPHADTLQQHAVPTPPLKGEDVEREAVRLFGPEGKTAIGAAPPAAPTFDIDVSSFATNRRVLEPIEAHIALVAGAGLAGLALLAVNYPRGFAYPFAIVAAWVAAALLFRGCALLRERHRRSRVQQ